MNAEEALPLGFQTAGITCGIKVSGKLDLALFVSDFPAVAAGVFTQNRVVGAPVIVTRDRVPSSTVRAVIINSGNSNACTGERGISDARLMTALVAERLNAREEDVLVCSTGVIGKFLPMEKISSGIRDALQKLSDETDHLRLAAQSIMTTDTVEKIVTRHFELRGKRVTITGVCKGAAMIAPNMATMLSVVMTDVQLPMGVATDMLRAAVNRSFNCISVEGHTSTSDTVLLLANGAAEVECRDAADLERFQANLSEVCMELSRKIIRDAEGAKHFVTVNVQGLPSEADARKIAKAVCDSPLVKTAVTGNDPNWGRIVSAAGYAGVPFHEPDLSLILNGVVIYEAGRPLDYDESALSNSMKSGMVTIDLQFRLGKAQVTYWTCDLTAEYIHLNADYTT
ncbi:bifunctional glutamate N-acetyltransferase/amino-acid acetyltransferase ArgJ [Planctomicrobium piriforme]|uniref:Arginine biosynthesis bifunctional protein ArgJ n=1 Tax=Planctomicrobium piriforme TaxID=1576369 RepID=A0A1I3PH69_9PLAN|nr:bifunctional glutamate N-acetyltransferase/amino-acid acetyltransferase ArgJ [Planctomicrobium piriforme]SFJ20639.1 glutamate N-acetyltransferase / amino-acid N-acetyltransferase [Planctomicrobium piriforme]